METTIKDESEINEPLLQKVMDHVTAHPEEFDMAEWATQKPDCGTTLCIAGHAAVMAGHDLSWSWWQRSPGSPPVLTAARTTGGHLIKRVAQEALGLTDEQAYRLFLDMVDRPLDRIWDHVEELTEGRVRRGA